MFQSVMTQAKAAVLDVRKTYRFLADQAKKNGAEIFVNTNVTEVITEDGKRLLE